MSSLLFLILLFTGGIILGSFLNACIYRIPRGISLLFPGSFCTCCRHPLGWWQNIPLISYLILRGRCYYCGHRISRRYPLVEMLSGLTMVMLFLKFGLSVQLFYFIFLLYPLILLSFIDIEHRFIPNALVIFLLLSGIFLNYLFLIIPWREACFGALLSGLLLFLIKLVSDGMMKRESMGMGDVKLCTCIGFFLGWQALIFVMFGASLLAIMHNILLSIVSREPLIQRIPLVPYLTSACFFYLIYFDHNHTVYLSLLY
jgi:leader peptidase (prepilin peptidase)/N-methyltransferase